MSNKFFNKLISLEGAVERDQNPYLNVLRSPSPSLNWTFANPGHGLPYGASMLLYGPPKGGKSIVCNSLIGQLHQDDPEAYAVVFNTEMRGAFQNNNEQFKVWGIDPERVVIYDVNEPGLIFDRIEQDLQAIMQEVCKIKLIIIDSLTAIAGRRTLNSDSVNKMQIGDQALTVKDGLLRILPVIRKNKIALVGTAHIRAELDQLEQMRGNTVKMAASWAAKHTFEYFCYVEPNRSKDGKVSLAGEEFTDPDIVDFMNNAQKTAHKIRFRVKESSMGPAGRTAEFTLDYKKGIINQYEEVFAMAKNLNILERPNNQTYQYKDKKWRGIVACLTAIKEDKTLRDELLAEIVKKDQNS
jgi:RecA/RadA recombinase